MNKEEYLEEEIDQLIRDNLQYSRGHQVIGITSVILRDSIVELIKDREAETKKRTAEEIYEDVLYRLSFMDAEDTIEDVIADVESRKAKIRNTRKETK